MNIFKLPDLGEGLPDAIIREWYVEIGQAIEQDQPMVAMETAKALVDVPAPFSGVVEKQFGMPGDTIDTGAPLIGFIGENNFCATEHDAGTVVGNLEIAQHSLHESPTTTVATASPCVNNKIKATPAVRMLAKQLGVDLNTLALNEKIITAEQVLQSAGMSNKIAPPSTPPRLSGPLIALSPARRSMAITMMTSQREVVPATLMDEVDLQHWEPQQDITIRIIRAIISGCQTVPILNSYYDGQHMAYQLNEQIHIGIAIDTEQDLYVPVLQNVAHQSDHALRETINRFKQQAINRCIPAADLKNPTILMSNIGAIAGQYAIPVVVPPMVAIVAIGRIKNTPPSRMLPISLTFDHRPITGGDAARFLKAMMLALSNPRA